MRRTFIETRNECFSSGIPAPTSKLNELLPKIAVAIHVFEHTVLNFEEEDFHMPTEIKLDTFQRAKIYVQFLEEQKEVFCQVGVCM